MADGYAALSGSQRADFDAFHAKFGMQPGALSYDGTLDTANFGGRLVLSADERESSVAPTHVPFRSMAELKSLIGVPDARFAAGQSDVGVAYPAPMEPARIAYLRTARSSAVTPEENAHLLTAAYAYVLGNSAKVKEFEPLLDAHFAPGTVAYIAADAMIVQNGQTVTIASSPTPLVLNVATVAVFGTGQIDVGDVALTMVVQAFTVAPG